MKKIIAAILIIGTIMTAATATDNPSPALDAKLADFAGQVADFMPRATAGTDLWADAHIGNILPLSGLPHLGAGFTAGAALIPTDFVSTFNEAFTTPANEWKSFPLPAVSVDARIGGFFLPFDVGVHVMALDQDEPVLNDVWGMTLDVTGFVSYGADVRLALIQENVILPAISIGVGYTHTEGTFDFTAKQIISLNNKSVRSSITFNTDIYTASLQVSKKILFLTPFAGAKAYVQNGTYWYGGGYQNIDNHTHGTISQGTINKEFSFDSLTPNDIKYSVFAGLGVDFLIIQTTVGVSYDFTDQSWAGSLSIHVKI